MCDGPIHRNIHEFMPHHIKHRRIAANDLWPNSKGIHNFIPRPVTASDLWPNSVSVGAPIIHNSIHQDEDDKSLHRLVKRTRTVSESTCSNSTQVEPESSFSSINLGHTVHVQEHNGCSMKAERFSGKTNDQKGNNWPHNLENRLAGKRKMCDLNVNLDDHLECSWPSLTESSDDEDDNDETSDSEAYSGPS